VKRFGEEILEEGKELRIAIVGDPCTKKELRFTEGEAHLIHRPDRSGRLCNKKGGKEGEKWEKKLLRK